MATESSLQIFPIDLKEFIILWKFYINLKGCEGTTGYWSKAILLYLLKKTLFL